MPRIFHPEEQRAVGQDKGDIVKIGIFFPQNGIDGFGRLIEDLPVTDGKRPDYFIAEFGKKLEAGAVILVNLACQHRNQGTDQIFFASISSC